MSTNPYINRNTTFTNPFVNNTTIGTNTINSSSGFVNPFIKANPTTTTNGSALPSISSYVNTMNNPFNSNGLKINNNMPTSGSINPFLNRGSTVGTNTTGTTTSYQPSINNFFPLTNTTNNTNPTNTFNNYLNSATYPTPSGITNPLVTTNNGINTAYSSNIYKPANPHTNTYNPNNNIPYQFNSSILNKSTYVSKDLTAALLKEIEYPTTREILQGSSSYMPKDIKVNLNSICFYPDFNLFSNEELRYFNFVKRKIKKNFDINNDLPKYNHCNYIDRLSIFQIPTINLGSITAKTNWWL